VSANTRSTSGRTPTPGASSRQAWGRFTQRDVGTYNDPVVAAVQRGIVSPRRHAPAGNELRAVKLFASHSCGVSSSTSARLLRHLSGGALFVSWRFDWRAFVGLGHVKGVETRSDQRAKGGVNSRGLDGTHRVCLYPLRAPRAQVPVFWRAQHRARDDRCDPADIFKLYYRCSCSTFMRKFSHALPYPIGTLLVCGSAPCCSKRTRVRVFLLFTFGDVTHYALDVLLIHVSGGLMLLYPLSWDTWALQLVRPDNWLGTTILVRPRSSYGWC